MLRATFGYASFRPLQAEIVQSILRGQDVFVLMPTGGGKSLCYQLPALMLDGLTVVVSPLIALMKDQVDALQARGVAATYINSSLDVSEVGRRQAAVARGSVKLLYVAPERLMLPGFLRWLATMRVSCFAIDEAHCISEWGHDFRPDYRNLTRLRDSFPSTTLAAFTATATTRVQADIKTQLALQQAACFQASFNRPNLLYAVWPKQDAYGQLVAYLRPSRRASGIIYCLSRAGTESLAARLKSDGFNAAAYHAGLGNEERRLRQEAFAGGEVDIVVATIAFGMGIDKPDVRFVVHFDMPKNLEGYYQESGRAGRDGLPSDCILFYTPGDAVKLRFFIDQKQTAREREIAHQQLRQMEDWATSTTCRRTTLLAYFGEQIDAQAGPCCDVCRAPAETVDCTEPARLFLNCMMQTGEYFGVAYVVRVLCGSGDRRILENRHDKLPAFGAGRDRSRTEWRHLVNELLRAGYIRQAPDEFNALKITARGQAVLTDSEAVKLAMPAHPTPVASSPEQQANQALFEQLREIRRRLAQERGVAAFVIFADASLRQMAAELPASREALQRISGVGPRKADDYGDLFLACIAEYVRQTGAQPSALPPRPRPAPSFHLGPTAQESLNLFRDGKSIEVIAAARGLAVTTIEGHLASAIEAGESIDADKLMSVKKWYAIESAIAKVGPGLLKPIMEQLGDGYSYGEIRLVLAGWIRRHRALQDAPPETV